MSIIAAVDTDDNADQILLAGAELVDNLNEELHVIHVREYSELRKDVNSDTKLDQRTIQQQIQDTVTRIATPFIDEFISVGLIGEPASEIISYADSNDATYIITGRKNQSPVGKAVFGSTTQQILLNGSCSVITILIDE